MVSAGIGVGLSPVPIPGIICSPTGLYPIGFLRGLGFSGHPPKISRKEQGRGAVRPWV